MNTLSKLFFACLIVFFAILLAILFSTPLAQATGMADTKFATLNRSGTSVATEPTIKWLAYFFGLGIVSIFCLCIFMGARKKQPDLRKSIYQTLGIGTLLYMVVYTLMVRSWWEYVATNSMDYFLGLPKPTAWLMFGLMFIPLFMSFLYIFKFNDWIIRPEEMEEFNRIMARRKSQMSKTKNQTNENGRI